MSDSVTKWHEMQEDKPCTRRSNGPYFIPRGYKGET